MAKPMTFEKEVMSYLETRPPIPIKDVIGYLMHRHTDEKTGRLQTGYSDRTIYGKLKRMEKDGQITGISPEDLRTYGIKQSDGRLQYISLKTASERKTHLDDVLSLLSSRKKIDIQTALEEIQRYKEKYTLNPRQLDILTRLLNKDFEGVETVVLILFDYIIKRQIHPSNTDELLQRLRGLTGVYEKNSDAQYRIRRNALRILGIYNDEGVIQQLKTDAKIPEKFPDLKNDYLSKYTARVIETHRSDLFHFQNTLKKNKQANIAEIISEIRTYATEHENDSLDYVDPQRAIDSPANPIFKGGIPSSRGKR